MKVTPKTDGVKEYYFGMEVHLIYEPRPYDPVARVIEFPKVWREDGKQYKVVDCFYSHNGEWDDVIIRVPQAACASAVGCSETIERY